MIRCRVSSGEYEIIVVEYSLLEAANMAIKLHDVRRLTSSLGILTLVEELDSKDILTGEQLFISTEILIEKNTNGCGHENGQYQKNSDSIC